MGCFDWFKFDKDFKFQNNKGDIVVIEKNIEFQTKDLDSIMNHLIINENNEIERLIFNYKENKEYAVTHPLRWKLISTNYEKINFSGKITIYHYTDEKDYVYDIWVENGKIYKIEDKCKKVI